MLIVIFYLCYFDTVMMLDVYVVKVPIHEMNICKNALSESKARAKFAKLLSSLLPHQNDVRLFARAHKRSSVP